MFPDRNFLGITKGWKDLGKVGVDEVKPIGLINRIIKVKGCNICSKRLNVGKQGEEVFLFCPQCFKKYIC